RVEGVHPEVIVVDSMARRRHGASVAWTSEVVLALDTETRRPLGERMNARGKLRQHPVDPWLGSGRIRVVAYERELSRALRRAGPRHRRRDVVALAGELPRDDGARVEGQAGDAKGLG